jgi:hypothetical protein
LGATARKPVIAKQVFDRRMRTFDPQRKPEHAALLRKLMHAFNAPRYCELAPCKRADKCMHPKVRCFWENFDLMQRRVFPAMRRKLKDMQAPGEDVPDEDDAAHAMHAAPVSNASKSKR